jgi:hypothetical protein
MTILFSTPNTQVTTNARDAKNSIDPYPVFSTTWIKPSYPGNSDAFGTSVAVSGRYMVVGAQGEKSNATGVNGDQTNNSGTNVGAAYVYYCNPNTGAWEFQAYLKPNIYINNGYFGKSVAIDGDTIAVGTIGSGTDQYVYIYVRTGVSTWAFQQRITSSNIGSGDSFGESLSIQGDVLAVGARGEDSNTTGINPASNESGSGTGAAYVFRRSAGVWAQEAFIKPNTLVSNSQGFGVTVSLHNNTLVIGAISGTLSHQRAEVYVYSGSWSFQQSLVGSNTEANDFFGISVSVYGDTICVGAQAEASSTTGINSTPDNSAVNAGAFYIFKRSAGVWSQTHYVKSSNCEASDQFGARVFIRGDRIIASASGEDGSGTGINPAKNNSADGTGAYYLFSYDGTTLTETHYLKNPVGTAIGTAMSGPVYCAALDTKIVAITHASEDSSDTVTGIQYGTPNTSGSNTGAVYVYNIL